MQANNSQWKKHRYTSHDFERLTCNNNDFVIIIDRSETAFFLSNSEAGGYPWESK
jgi:hypothetical protein